VYSEGKFLRMHVVPFMFNAWTALATPGAGQVKNG